MSDGGIFQETPVSITALELFLCCFIDVWYVSGARTCRHQMFKHLQFVVESSSAMQGSHCQLPDIRSLCQETDSELERRAFGFQHGMIDKQRSSVIRWPFSGRAYLTSSDKTIQKRNCMLMRWGKCELRSVITHLWSPLIFSWFILSKFRSIAIFSSSVYSNSECLSLND